MYSGPSTWMGWGWNGRPLRDMSAPCLNPLCVLWPASQSKRLRRSYFLGLSTLRTVSPHYYLSDRCVCFTRTIFVNFLATKPPLSAHCSEKLAPELTSPTLHPLIVAEKVDTSVVSRVYERWAAPCCFTRHDLSFTTMPTTSSKKSDGKWINLSPGCF